MKPQSEYFSVNLSLRPQSASKRGALVRAFAMAAEAAINRALEDHVPDEVLIMVTLADAPKVAAATEPTAGAESCGCHEAAWAEKLAAAERERDEARWNPLEDYHKTHVPACRKFMYDQKSSPCTCRLEWDRLLFDSREAESRATALAAEVERLRGGLGDMCREWRLHGQLTDSCRPAERLLGIHAPFCPVHSKGECECDLARRALAGALETKGWDRG